MIAAVACLGAVRLLTGQRIAFGLLKQMQEASQGLYESSLRVIGSEDYRLGVDGCLQSAVARECVKVVLAPLQKASGDVPAAGCQKKCCPEYNPKKLCSGQLVSHGLSSALVPPRFCDCARPESCDSPLPSWLVGLPTSGGSLRRPRGCVGY